MKKKINRTFKEDDLIYVVDYCATSKGPKACVSRAFITSVDEEKRIIDTVISFDYCQSYSFDDYKRLFFDTLQEANEAANKLPTPGSDIYQIIDDKVVKKTVEGIYENPESEIIDLVICLDTGDDVSTKELGKSLFKKAHVAVKMLETLRKKDEKQKSKTKDN